MLRRVSAETPRNSDREDKSSNAQNRLVHGGGRSRCNHRGFSLQESSSREIASTFQLLAFAGKTRSRALKSRAGLFKGQPEILTDANCAHEPASIRKISLDVLAAEFRSYTPSESGQTNFPRMWGSDAVDCSTLWREHIKCPLRTERATRRLSKELRSRSEQEVPG
jgi:hypothetical protein